MKIKPIKNLDDLTSSKSHLARLMRGPKKGDLNDEIDVLATLVEQYEQKNFPIDMPDPISAIKFRMEEGGLTPRQLEPYIGSRARVSEVLSGKRQLSLEMIRSLHVGLGIPYEALLADRGKREGEIEVSENAVLRLNEFGFELAPKQASSFIATSLNHRVPTLNAFLRNTRTQRAAAKTDQGALLLWQAAVMQRARLPHCDFDRSQFGYEQLRQIARMSTKENGPRLAVSRLAELGVSVVILPSLPGTFLDGAAMMGPSGAPVIGLTLRHDRIDNFWFTLLHECAHVSLHLGEVDQFFVDDMEVQSLDRLEGEADTLARDALIPPSILNQLSWDTSTTDTDVIALATRARVHPSIVAGRWQKDHQNYKKFARLIDRTSVLEIIEGRA